MSALLPLNRHVKGASKNADPETPAPSVQALQRAYNSSLLELVEKGNKDRKVKAQQRQKDGLNNLDYGKTPFGEDMVIVRKFSRILAHVPLAKFKKWAPEIYKDLDRVDQQYQQQGLKILVFQPKCYVSGIGLKQWAIWLSTQNIKKSLGGSMASFDTILDALNIAYALQHNDYHDAIMDYAAYRLCLGFRENLFTVHKGVDKDIQASLRQLAQVFTPSSANSMLEKLFKVLVLHYDVDGVMARDVYPSAINDHVTAQVFGYWQHKDEEALPRDPVKFERLEEWCKPYHLHSKEEVCWIIKKSLDDKC
ncbi:hypothetical protein AUEXF2481DRAFT_32617 [Aureobasidium subglaciale EXF-2481]|uniref:Uncharacterized protein n=1 Tax=Aureobasidium subglaciale (strain EXF-2481) TaxID=1043005 RepID=A0A074YCK8_AURSE|nr:uncharacterized protein AUEXF2481DRAFT_32617 [Aureobasidium subglaciale EXF-2481]KAI5204071.1 hypothetical protein E4T38_04832 [Aureobasidium subglaciale]KAI5222772.1 hypothetical protein E4T40_04746 [Aureobasidium subglaciale]KAI5226680.1 hypothetical protein E4T41_04689 [Aureobasidium subglaciale]KAI5263132.1 hypothetical protein E4T46_03934 [Aureobasidium subglaciale]KEQ91872.1 hypothetical protein AUEXF2481DRAFT_32617 [Aureobasidium subglaciale EXF-2481]